MEIWQHILVIISISGSFIFLDRWVYETWRNIWDMLAMTVLSTVFWLFTFLLFGGKI